MGKAQLNDKDIANIQEKLISNLNRLDAEKVSVKEEVARVNAISQLANTYIKTCNLIIRVQESKVNVKQQINEIGKK